MARYYLHDLHKILLTARKARKMSQRQLADKVGISVPAISMYERGKSRPSLPMLALIADALQIEILFEAREK